MNDLGIIRKTGWFGLAGFRYLVIKKQAEYEWVGTLTLVSGAVWWAVSLIADGLQGGAILGTVGGTTNPTVVKALVEGTLLIYNGAIALTVTGFFMALAGYSILGTRALPKWVCWFACVFCGTLHLRVSSTRYCSVIMNYL